MVFVAQFIRRSDGELNAAENAKRKLSTDFTLTKAHLDMKSRDGH